MHENRFDSCPLSAGADVYGFWAERLFPFHTSAATGDPLALQFFGAVSASHFAAFFFALQIVGGLLLLAGSFVPLALTLLAAELYNILAFHITLAPGMAPALVACVLWVLVFLQYRESFNCIFSAKPVTRA